MNRRIALSAACLLFPAICGCGEGPKVLPTEPVTGIVTLDGKPVADATVIFSPSNAQGKEVYAATATTGADGKYSLTTSFSPSVDKPGAVAGEYAVTVTKYKKGAATTSAPSMQDMAKMMGENKDKNVMRRGPRPGAAADPNSELPTKYSTASGSGIVFKVPGTNFDIKMESK